MLIIGSYYLLLMMPTSSGLRWTGSSVNSWGKLARTLSLSSLGLYGGGICFYFSSAESIVWQYIVNNV